MNGTDFFIFSISFVGLPTAYKWFIWELWRHCACQWLGAASWWAIIWTVRLRQRMKGDDYEHAGNTISLLLSTIFHLANKNIFDVGGQRAKTGFSSQMHLRFSIGFYLRRLLNKLKIAMQTVDRKPSVTWADNTMVRKIFNCNTEKYLKQWGCETIFSGLSHGRYWEQCRTVDNKHLSTVGMNIFSCWKCCNNAMHLLKGVRGPF